MFDRLVEIAEAIWSPKHPLRCFHISFVLKKKKIIAIGINSVKTHTSNLKHPKFANSNPSLNIKADAGACSELQACLKLKNKTNIKSKKCVLVNIRINKHGEVKNSKPCQSCANLLNYFEFKDVYYSNNEGAFNKY